MAQEETGNRHQCLSDYLTKERRRPKQSFCISFHKRLTVETKRTIPSNRNLTRFVDSSDTPGFFFTRVGFVFHRVWFSFSRVGSFSQKNLEWKEKRAWRRKCKFLGVLIFPGCGGFPSVVAHCSWVWCMTFPGRGGSVSGVWSRMTVSGPPFVLCVVCVVCGFVFVCVRLAHGEPFLLMRVRRAEDAGKRAASRWSTLSAAWSRINVLTFAARVPSSSACRTP